MALPSTTIADMVTGGLALSAGIYLGIKKLRDDKTRKRIKKMEEDAGLDPNPTRCERHETRLGQLEGKTERFEERFLNIQGDIGEIKSDVKSLLSRKI
jgi:hypothetical protein